MDRKELIKSWLKIRYDKFATTEKTPKIILKWIIWFLLAVFGFFVALILLLIIIVFPSLPNINNIQNLVAAQSSGIYDREGNLLYLIHGEENREVVSLKDISQYAIEAVLAIEDDQFYSHGAVDFGAMLKAVCSEAHICSQQRGGSTITQQFIKNAFLSPERTYTRKLKEIILSIELESKYSKDQILEMYLNRIPYGSSIYGIEMASKIFFGKSVKDLTLGEAAVLAAIPKAPSYFSPYGSNLYASINLDASDIIRMNIKSEQQLVNISPDFVTKGLLGKTYKFGACAEEVKLPEETKDSKDAKNSDNKKTGSSKETTSESGPDIKPDETQTGECREIYIKGRTDFVLSRMGELGYIKDNEYDQAIKEAEHLQFKPFREEIKAPHFVMYIRQLLEEKYGKDQIEKGGLKITTTLDPKMQDAAEKAVADYAKKNLESYNADNSALVAMNPDDGQILAMVGSNDYWNDSIDGKVNVALRPRLPGSSFKPIVYAAAFLQGYAPGTVLYDVKTKFGATYSPENYDRQFRGPVTMRQALANSLNIPAVKAGYLAGIPNVLDLARRMGIQLNQPDDWYGLSLAIGAGEARLLDMVGAFSIFASGGYKTDPVAILKIEDRNGNILEEYTKPQNRALILDPQVAYLINNVLSDAEARPEGWWRSQLTIPGQINGAKTGTSNKKIKGVDYPFDTWTLGYTRRLAAGVWSGNTDGSILGSKADGLSTAAYIWHEFMVAATKDMPREDFEKPEGIKYVKISSKTGKLPSEYTPEDAVTTGIFASFSVPKETDTSYKVVKIDKVSGKLATEFTPESAIEEKAFFEHHSEFPDKPQWEEPVRKWAEENNQDEVAPTEYDDVHTAETMGDKPMIVIKSPTDLATVSPPSIGVWVDVSSKSGINYVEYYWDDELKDTVKNPPHKGTIEINKSTEDGSTHVIKAIAYDSLYVSNQSSIQVKIGIDDVAPTVEFAYPGDGIRLDAGTSMSAQANATDAKGDILKVEFYLDSDLSATIKQPPYVWQFVVPGVTGEHVLKAIVYDHASNKSDAQITIVAKEPDSTIISGDNSQITEPYKNQSFNQGQRVLIQAALSKEAQENLKELIVSAKKKDGKTITIAKATGNSETGGAYVYTFIWDSVPAGIYDLSLKIVLQDGTIRFSGKVPIVVR